MLCLKKSNGKILFLSVLFCFLTSLSFATTEIKVGYFFDGDYMYKTEDGGYAGYDVEYLYEIARYSDWKYVFVDYETFEAECAALEKGEIDILPAMFYSKERAQKFLFSKLDMGRLYVTIVVPETDQVHSYGDYNSFNGMRIGVLEDTIDGQRVENLCKEKKLNTTIVHKKTNTELLEALDSGELDAIGETFLGASSKYHVIAEFDPMLMYFIVSKSKPEIVAQIDSAMDRMSINNPYFQNLLYQKYFSVSNGQTPIFSVEEKEAIKKSGVVRVALQINNPPYGYVDKKGNYAGAVVDLFNRIGEMSGLHFIFVPVENATLAMENVHEGKADVVGRCLDDSIVAAKYGIMLTNPYIKVTLTQISKKKTTEIHKVGVTQFVKPFYTIRSVYATNVSEKNAADVYFADSNKCFEALAKDKVDAVVVGSARANYFMNTNRASEYVINEMNGDEFGIAAGVNVESDKNIFAVINKCIHYTGSSIINDYILRHSVASSASLQTFLSRIPIEVAIVFIAVLLLLVILLVVIIFIFIYWTRQEGQLRLAQKENQIKNDFMGTMSHDMRTPLNAVLGFANLGIEANEIQKKNELFTKITQAGDLLLNLVNSALLISKVENKKFELHPQPTDCKDLLEEVAISIKASAEKKHINFIYDDSKVGFGYILVDRLNLQKIFLNLLSNAVNYTNDGGEVTFSFERIEHPKNDITAKAVIRDNGIGMSKSFIAKMYEPFTQERMTTDTQMSGAGLGLSIVKQLVGMMHGSIEVKSELGKGTEFTIFLPIKVCTISQNVKEVIAFPPQETSSISHDERDRTLMGKHILLCEDNAMNREIAQSLFEAKDISVAVAENGQNGVHLFAESVPYSFDAIFMDIRMPLMNGYEATKKIRSLERTDARTVPIIAMTADAFEEDVQKCAEAGMNAHVSKPIEQEVLFTTLYRLIAKEQ